MGMNGELNKVTATLKVVVTGEFYEDNVSEETLRYFVEQDLEDDGFDVDVELLKEQEAVEPIPYHRSDGTIFKYECRQCRTKIFKMDLFCRHCGRPVKWE